MEFGRNIELQQNVKNTSHYSLYHKTLRPQKHISIHYREVWAGKNYSLKINREEENQIEKDKRRLEVPHYLQTKQADTNVRKTEDKHQD